MNTDLSSSHFSTRKTSARWYMNKLVNKTLRDSKESNMNNYQDVNYQIF